MATKNTAVEVNEVSAEIAELEESTARGVTDVDKAIRNLNDPESGYYSSIKNESFADGLKVASALTSSKPLDEHLGETINLRNFIVMPVDLADEKSGEITTQPRVIIIDDAGESYHATSVGLLSALNNIVAGLNRQPADWPEAIPVKVVRQKGRNGYSFFTLKFA